MQKLMHPLKRLGEIKLGPQNTADLSFCQSTYRVLRTVAHYFYEAENVSKIWQLPHNRHEIVSQPDFECLFTALLTKFSS